MPYCRFSSDNFDCDVYCYEDSSGGYTTHVAANRVNGEVPRLADMDGPLEAVLASHRIRDAFLETAVRTPIGLPCDGQIFHDESLDEVLTRLQQLKEVGYHVPVYAIESVKNDILQEGQEKNEQPSESRE